MKLVILTESLEKGRPAMAEGTRKQHTQMRGGKPTKVWVKKLGKKWVYDGMVEPKNKGDNVGKRSQVRKDVIKGTPEQKKELTATKEFKEWFGESKVEKSGQPTDTYNTTPAKMYHGTARGGFTEFKNDGSTWGIYGSGLYFTEAEDIAQEYADTKDISETDNLKNAIGYQMHGKELKFLPDNDKVRAELENMMGEVRNEVKEAWDEASTKDPDVVNVEKLLSGLTEKLSTKKPMYKDGPVRDKSAQIPYAKLHMAGRLQQIYPNLEAIVPDSQVFEVFLKVENPVDMDEVVSREDTETFLTGLKGQENTFMPYVDDLFTGFEDKFGFDYSGGIENYSYDLLLQMKQELRDSTYDKDFYGFKGVLRGKAGDPVFKVFQQSDRDVLTHADIQYLLTNGQKFSIPYTKALQGMGYDGIHHTGGWNIGTKPHSVWIAFEGQQVKSTANTGTFDTGSADIMKSTEVLEKGRPAAPENSRRQHTQMRNGKPTKVWVKKLGGKWVYDGTVDSKAKTSNVGKRSKIRQAHADSLKPKPDVGYVAFTQDQADKLKQKFTRRDRISYGQEVKYHGRFHKNRQGREGKLVAIGSGGFAMVQFPDGKVDSANWRDITPVGKIQPHSLYDGVDSNNIYSVEGEVRATLDKTMKQKIGNSKMDYYDLADEFRRQGFNLQVVGGTVRDILGKKGEIKDVDFIFNGTDRELFSIVKKINPAWVANAVTNKHLGLCSFTDGSDVVDITPVHKFSREMNDMAKGWNLADDARSRDLAMNSLQIDPLSGVMVDATGNGIADIDNNTMNFCDEAALKVAPNYTLRAFKFMGRGYKVSAEADTAIKKNLKYVSNLSPRRKESFLRRQIGDKDGATGLKNFKENFRKYNTNIWDREFEQTWRAVYRQMGGKP